VAEAAVRPADQAMKAWAMVKVKLPNSFVVQDGRLSCASWSARRHASGSERTPAAAQ
jgi:hypothetical protein